MNAQTAEPDATRPLFSIRAGNPSPAELAAISAVVEGMVEELESSRHAEKLAGPTGWEQSARPVAVSIVPAHGAWRAISG